MTITRDFERFQSLSFETSFLKNLKFRPPRIKAQHFHAKLSRQKFRQSECGMQPYK